MDSIPQLVVLLEALVCTPELIRSEDYVAECMRVVVSLASVSKEHVASLGRTGCCGLLMDVIEVHQNSMSVSVCGLSLSAVSCLAASKENQSILGQQGACELVVNMLSHNSNFLLNLLAIAEQGLWALRNLAVNRDNQVLLGAAGACQVVAAIMTIHGSNSMLAAEQGLRAITNLAVNYENRISFQVTNICTSVVLVLSIHGPRSVTLAEAGLWAVRNLAAQPECQALLGREGVCQVVINMMNVYSSNQSIAELGLRALINLAVDDDNKTRIGAADGCKTVVSILNTHGRASMAVAEQGLWAIRNLSTENMDNQIRFGREGACELVVIMLRWYISVRKSHHENIALQAANAICNLAMGSEENKRKLIKLKAISELEAIMADSMLSEDVHQEAYEVIEELRY